MQRFRAVQRNAQQKAPLDEYLKQLLRYLQAVGLQGVPHAQAPGVMARLQAQPLPVKRRACQRRFAP